VFSSELLFCCFARVSQLAKDDLNSTRRNQGVRVVSIQAAHLKLVIKIQKFKIPFSTHLPINIVSLVI
jgi:hypothetical protein